MNHSGRWQAFFDRPAPNMILRLAVMFCGLSFVAASVALTRATGLGTSPISCIPATLSYLTPLSIGTWTFIMNSLFVAVQIALLRRDFKPVQFLQLPFVFVFSALIDVFVPWCTLIPMPNYLVCFAWNILGCFMTAFGVFLQVKASVLTLPGEGIVLTIARVTKIAFPKCKMAFDSSMVAIAAAISLATMGGLFGVREGTVISALAVGAIVGLYTKLFPHFQRFCPIEGHVTFTIGTIADADTPARPAADAAGAGATPLVVTVSREFGSGGREIGQIVGKRLGIPVFDETLIELVAKESGLTVDYVKEHEEEVRRGVLYNLYMQNYQTVGAEPTHHDRLFLAQARTVTRLVNEGSCVIVGRCSNALTAGRDNVFNVFVHAPIGSRIERVMRREGVDGVQAKAAIERIDRERAEHCRRYTNTEWGRADAYHLCIDSSLQSSEETAAIVCSLAQAAFPDAPTSPCPEKPAKRQRR